MRHNESDLQIACVKWFRLAYPELGRLLFSVPNGGYRNAITAKVMKAEGQLAGVADLILMLPSGAYHALCIEMKTKKGRQQESQKAFQRNVEAQGYKYVICRSFEDFRREVCQYMRHNEEA